MYNMKSQNCSHFSVWREGTTCIWLIALDYLVHTAKDGCIYIAVSVLSSPWYLPLYTVISIESWDTVSVSDVQQTFSVAFWIVKAQ